MVKNTSSRRQDRAPNRAEAQRRPNRDSNETTQHECHAIPLNRQSQLKPLATQASSMRRRPSPIPEGLESETAQSQVSYQATLIERYLLVFTSPDSLLIHNPRRAIPRILPRHEHTVKRIDQSRLVPPSPFQSEDLPKEIETAQSKRPRYTRHRRSETIPSISPAKSTAERTSYPTRIVPEGPQLIPERQHVDCR